LPAGNSDAATALSLAPSSAERGTHRARAQRHGAKTKRSRLGSGRQQSLGRPDRAVEDRGTGEAAGMQHGSVARLKVFLQRHLYIHRRTGRSGVDGAIKRITAAWSSLRGGRDSQRQPDTKKKSGSTHKSTRDKTLGAIPQSPAYSQSAATPPRACGIQSVRIVRVSTFAIVGFKFGCLFGRSSQFLGHVLCSNDHAPLSVVVYGRSESCFDDLFGR